MKCVSFKKRPKSGQTIPPLPDRVRCVWSTPSPQADVLAGTGMPSAHRANSLPTPALSSPSAQAARGLPPPAPSRAATHRFLGMVPVSGAAGVAAGDAPAADAALRALHSLVLGASWGRPSRWPDRTRSRRRARPASGSRSLAPASPAASAMASALCRRPRPLGAGERSLRAAPRATIRCGASRQSLRRLAAGALRLELQRALSPPTAASPRPSPPRLLPPPRLATPRLRGTCRAGEFQRRPDWPKGAGREPNYTAHPQLPNLWVWRPGCGPSARRLFSGTDA